MPIIDNDDDMTIAIAAEMQGVMDVVSQKLLQEFKWKILEVVYDPFFPKEYNRQMSQGGLLKEWVRSNAFSIDKITTEINEDPSLLVLDQSHYIHGSIVGNIYSDIRNSLAEIVDEGKSGSLWDWTTPPFWWKTPRPFYEEFIKMLDNGEIVDLINKEFKRRGIDFIVT